MPGGAPRGKRHAPNGAGSVYKETLTKADGTPYIRWTGAITLPSGKRKRITAPTQREALAKLKQLQADQAKGLRVAPERQTVADYLTWWLEHSVRCRATTRVVYGHAITKHLIPALGKYQLAKLRPQHVEQMMTDMERAGYAPATINSKRAVLRAALTVAVDRDLIAKNVASQVKPARVEVTEPEPLSPEECQRWIDALKPHRLGALWIMAIATGLRRGELIGLRWQDLDLDHARLSVRQQIQLVPGPNRERLHVSVPLKTKQSNRNLPLPSFVVDLLRHHRGQQSQQRELLGPDWQEHGLVFAGRDGRPRDGAEVWRQFQRALDTAGIERHPFHYLRHVYQSLLVGLGTHPFVAMALLGHSELRTSRLYSHIQESAKVAAVDQLDALLRR